MKTLVTATNEPTKESSTVSGVGSPPAEEAQQQYNIL